QIHRWMRDHAPHREALLQPPLTRQQIDEIVESTGFVLPEEAYTLYEWRNGVADCECLFPGYEFRPLEEGGRRSSQKYLKFEFHRPSVRRSSSLDKIGGPATDRTLRKAVFEPACFCIPLLRPHRHQRISERTLPS